MDAVGDAALYMPVQRHAALGQEGDLLPPRFMRRVFDGDMIECLRMHGRVGGRRRSLNKRNVVVTQFAVPFAAVETHRGPPAWIGAAGCADMAEAEQLGPETMRFQYRGR